MPLIEIRTNAKTTSEASFAYVRLPGCMSIPVSSLDRACESRGPTRHRQEQEAAPQAS
jgi:hypothetical protein